MSRTRAARFSIVKNEIYQLPQFLDHYRRLGIAEFLYYDDSSTDGTLERFLAQPDVGCITSSIFSGRKIGGPMRWATVVKSVLPAQLFDTKWVVVADADEYLVLPEPFPDLPAFSVWLQDRGNRLVAASLVDCYPASLAERNGDPTRAPSEYFPSFDRGALFHCERGQLAPRGFRAGARARLPQCWRSGSPTMRPPFRGRWGRTRPRCGRFRLCDPVRAS